MDNRCKVFTPPDIAKYMLDVVGYVGDLYGKKIVENSCGEGNLLYEIVHRYLQSMTEKPSSYTIKGLERDIVGFDIDKNCCDITKRRLDELALEYGIRDVKWNIQCFDALIAPDANEYDFVIGNPPYISYRKLEAPVREWLRENYVSCKNGAFDYCYAFIEHAINSLKPGGKMIYLVPSSIFKNVHGNELRRIMIDDLKEVHDYTSLKLFGKVLTSSALIFCVRGESNSHIVYKDMAIKKTRRIKKTLLGRKWVFSSKRDINMKKARFGDYFTSSIVIATLLNSVYVISGYQEQGEYIVLKDGRSIEKSITREAVSPRNLRNKRKERIIFPYCYDTNGELIRLSEQTFISNYPGANEYLSSYRKELDKRDADKQSTWFEFGRSQALKRINQDKLLLSTVITGNVEVYRLGAECVPYAGIMITSSGNVSLDKAQALLRSPDFMSYVKGIGTYANGHSMRITPDDIANFTFNKALLTEHSRD